MMAILVQSGDPGRKGTPPRLQEDLRRRHQRPTATTEFGAALDALDIAQHRVAKMFGVGPRSVRRWQYGDRRVPRGVDILLRLMACGAVSIDEVERVAVAIPARANGDAKPEPPAPLLVTPAPEQSVVAPAAAATHTDPDYRRKGLRAHPRGLLLAVRRPGHPDFHFCGSPVAKRPYCEHHRAIAYMAPLTGSGHGAPIGLVTHGWRSPTTKQKSVHGPRWRVC